MYLHMRTLHCIALHRIPLDTYITVHFVPLRQVTLPYLTLLVTLPYLTLRHVTLL